MVLALTLDDDAIYGIPRPLVPACVSSVADAALAMDYSTGYLSPGFDVDLLERVFLNLFGQPKVSLLNCALALLGCSFMLLMQSRLTRVKCLLGYNY